MTADASAASGVTLDPTTVAELAVFPFNSGMSNTLLFPPWTPFHLPNVCPSPKVQVKAPTHGWTFHPTSRVTLARSESMPVMSVIWYFGFEFLRRIIPGATGFGSCFFAGEVRFALVGFF